MSNLTTQLISLEPRINSNGIVEWGVKNIIPIVLLFIGIGIIAGARRGRMSENAMTITNVLLGCVLIAGAGLFFAFAGNIAGFVFKG
jgi:cytochrome c-type biogenesis protein CcmH/NrfF